jgi:hypothetical protein
MICRILLCAVVTMRLFGEQWNGGVYPFALSAYTRCVWGVILIRQLAHCLSSRMKMEGRQRASSSLGVRN